MNAGQIDPMPIPVIILLRMESEYFELLTKGMSPEIKPAIASAIPRIPQVAQPMKYIFSSDIFGDC